MTDTSETAASGFAPPSQDPPADQTASNRPSPVEFLRNGEIRLHYLDRRIILRRPKVRELRTIVERNLRTVEEHREVSAGVRAEIALLDEEEQPLADRAGARTGARSNLLRRLRAAALVDDDDPLAADRDPNLLARYEEALEAGPLDADETVRLEEIRAEKERLLLDLDEKLAVAVLAWWVDVVALLSGQTVDPEELDAGLVDLQLPAKAIAHLRTAPLARGG